MVAIDPNTEKVGVSGRLRLEVKRVNVVVFAWRRVGVRASLYEARQRPHPWLPNLFPWRRIDARSWRTDALFYGGTSSQPHVQLDDNTHESSCTLTTLGPSKVHRNVQFDVYASTDDDSITVSGQFVL